MSQLRNWGSSQASFQPLKALSTSACQRLSFVAQIGRSIGLARPRDLGESHVLGEEVGRDQHQAAHPVVLDRARIDRGDRSAVAVTDEEAAAKGDRIEEEGSTSRASSCMKVSGRGSFTGDDCHSLRANRRRPGAGRRL